MYSFDSRIRYSEVDSDAELTVESLIDYFQDCSTFQTQDGPATMEYMKERGIAWVLNSWQIVINRLPKLCEEVTIGTVPYELKGVFGLRNFFMDTKDGERLAVANSIWTLFDFENQVPARITPEMVEAYPLEEKLPMEYGSRKIAIPKEAEKRQGEEILVRKHHLDTNNHVNNGQYIRMAIESLHDKKINFSQLRAEYKKQALLGDVLYPVIYKVEKEKEKVYAISLNDENESPVCIVELTHPM
ncbi:acyl-[acyl-carrier-protein] thioesterase [Butyrivibrio proteoclasticus]|uniref:acyl-[acyl-carrier-protein] thioesterase n=1 Tax=Butyrivibrio proteoclasticus TaxID=43305 RepID=UPI00047AB199|nr:acyl-ACP thioesterase domain-containing protein [Butyrivibrio proteoclasticus]